MPTRRFPALAFVLLCLALSGLVLRRQMAAHPVRPAPSDQEQGAALPPAFGGRWPTIPGWHTASGPTRRAVLASVQGQLDAFRAGDADKAMFYQSQGLRHNFASPAAFLDTIRTHYPEFGDCRSVHFSQVGADKTAQYAEVVVTVRGPDGRAARGDYEMVMEDGRYRVLSVAGGGPVRE